jgi:hypothetical protein
MSTRINLPLEPVGFGTQRTVRVPRLQPDKELEK